MKKSGKKRAESNRISAWIGRFFLLIILILSFSLKWAYDNFGAVSFDEIVFHVMMPLDGVSSDMLLDYLSGALFPAFGVWLLIMSWMLIPVRRGLRLMIRKGNAEHGIGLFPLTLGSKLAVSILAVWLCILLFVADQKFAAAAYLKSQFARSTLIEEEYVSPADVRIRFPEKKRNLICIYIESGETSSQDYANGGLCPVNYIPELTALAKENVSFSQSDLIEGSSMPPGTEWTIGGLVAETAGLPLKLPANYNNSLGRYQRFLPGAKSLGEILAENDYHNYFMAGSDFSFGGRRDYFSQHGDYTILDAKWARKEGKVPADYSVFWGIEDCKLFSIAKETLLEIAAKDEPFNFSILTVDTHTPNGYVCELCGNEYSNQYANVWACSSSQIGEFVRWIQEQSFYDNTTVVLSGDHVSMHPSFYGADTKDDFTGQCKRKVYECFVNPAVVPEKEQFRKFTTMDMFPSVLAAIGAQIEGERLGLGTNLFSGEDTLSEKYGYEYLFTELKKKSVFYDAKLLFGEFKEN